jgi:hypothetical protein
VGDDAVYGWTLGPVDEHGTPSPSAVDDADDLAAHARYITRVLDRIDQTVEWCEAEYGVSPPLAVEPVTVPFGWRHRKTDRIALGDWLTPRTVLLAITAVYPGALIVRPGSQMTPRVKYGQRHKAEPAAVRPISEFYPGVFVGRRPEGWGPNEARRGERDHERAAYDVAGVGAAYLEQLAAAAEVSR